MTAGNTISKFPEDKKQYQVRNHWWAEGSLGKPQRKRCVPHLMKSE